MTEPDTPQNMPADRTALAGEYALGLLEGEALDTARRRMLADRAFAADVVWWESALGDLAADGTAIAPDAVVWRAIEQRLVDSVDDADGRVATLPPAPPRQAASNWSMAALVSGAMLAGVSLMLYLSTPRIDPAPASVGDAVAQPAPQLIARLKGAGEGPDVATRIDLARNDMAVNVTGMTLPADGARMPELWVVPAGGAPVSLGMLPAEGSFVRALAPHEATMLVDGATLAITYEDRATAPHDGPTSAIVASGSLMRV